MDKKYDVLVLGELNVDLLLYRISSFPEIGKEVIAEDMQLALGSSSAIFAANISALGMRTAFVGCVGQDYYGDFIKKTLEEKGVATQAISHTETLATGMTIVMNVGDDRAMLTYPGAMNDLSLGDISDEVIQSARHLHFSSFFLQANIRKGVQRLFEKAKKFGLSTSFDMQWDPEEKWDIDIKNILPNVDFFLPNKLELISLTKTNDLDAAIKSLSPHFNSIIVKKGAEGATFFSSKTRIDYPAFRNTKPVDAIGAGDSFNAGFVFKFLQNEDMEICLHFANLMGAINTTAKGGTAAFQNYTQIIERVKQFGWTVKQSV